ncbi:hypothetical protein CONLIGDRAFT_709848 [Coniochaeta ligniaria NRRL 30616]|uniref:Uncharacterized protein n=1 Tax=Coniochaeta ligniaria NRRL 30616 TaxID=1408157 RepID=A0A1J7J4Y7_9PEZI|nr:hypothetical protein CONLIGDRAFT_709848 [Coniochaeta ligniaria NRRL 30616]
MPSPPPFSSKRPEEASPQKYRWERVLKIAEIGPASLCSLILWQYAGRLDAPPDSGYINDSQVAGPVFIDFFRYPAPKLVLISALGFGCCVSSFGYRRQREDPFQAVVFALVVGTVATVAYGLGESPNMMLLGYMPFATCAAMIFSLCGHAIVRWTRPEKGNKIENQEKLQLL